MSLSEPFRAPGLANPDGQGVVVERFGFRFSVGVARKAAEDAIRGDRGVRRKDADLQVAKFVRSQLAVFEEDQRGIQGLNRAVHLDVVRGEQAADGIEIALGERRPQVLFLVDDFDRSGGRRRRLGLRDGEGGDREKEEEAAHGDYANSCLPVGVKDLVDGGFAANLPPANGASLVLSFPAGLAFYVRDWRNT